jgi:diguanylate cyclase (GGDEF)-like protein
MGLRIMVLGGVSAQALRELRAVDGGSEILVDDDARAALGRIAADAPHAVALATQFWGKSIDAHPLLRALDNEFARALRYRHPISVMCASVDALATLKDAHGETLEVYLSKLEDALRASLRGMDLAARVDENEVVIVLPDTAAAGACAVAERLRTVTAHLLVRAADAGGRQGLPIKATCSFGVADAPAEGIVNARDVLARAREAMASARAAGGDRVAAA